MAALGVERWIVELPLPGQTQPGRLILNPSRQQSNSFTVLKTDREGRASGCITGHSKGLEQCAPMLIDTGSWFSTIREQAVSLSHGGKSEEQWPATRSRVIALIAGSKLAFGRALRWWRRQFD